MVDALAGYGREATSVVARFPDGKGLRYEMDGILTIERLSRSWQVLDIQLLVLVVGHPSVKEWKIVTSAKDKRL